MDGECDWVPPSILNLRAPSHVEVRMNWGEFPVPNLRLGVAKVGVSVRTPMVERRYAHSLPVPPPGFHPRRSVINGSRSTHSFSSFGSSSGPTPLLL